MANINQELARLKQSICIKSVEDVCGALTMMTSIVPDKDDLKTLQAMFETLYKAKIAAGEMMIRVKIPSSKSCLKINDFLYFNGFTAEHEPVKWTGELLKQGFRSIFLWERDQALQWINVSHLPKLSKIRHWHCLV